MNISPLKKINCSKHSLPTHLVPIHTEINKTNFCLICAISHTVPVTCPFVEQLLASHTFHHMHCTKGWNWMMSTVLFFIFKLNQDWVIFLKTIQLGINSSAVVHQLPIGSFLVEITIFFQSMTCFSCRIRCCRCNCNILPVFFLVQLFKLKHRKEVESLLTLSLASKLLNHKDFDYSFFH